MKYLLASPPFVEIHIHENIHILNRICNLLCLCLYLVFFRNL